MYRRYRLPTIWQEMDRVQREMNRLMSSNFPFRNAPGYPAVNVWANQEELVITAEAPGVNAEDIDVSVVGETLTLSGVRRPDEITEGTRYHRQERGYGKFVRTVQLPYIVDVERVQAEFKNGILSITMPRAEADKPRKIAVKALLN
jgi:HSP20 family protein